MAQVQTPATASNTSTSPQATFSSAPTEGNTLFATLRAFENETDVSAASGWEIVVKMEFSTGAFTVAIAIKEAGASESSTQTPFSLSTSAFWNCSVHEDDILLDWGGTYIVDTSEADDSGVTSLAPGSLTGGADGDLCVGALAANASLGGGLAITEGWTVGAVGGADGYAYFAKGDGASENPSFSWNNSVNAVACACILAAASSDQNITPGATSLSVSPGSLSVTQDQPVTPAPVSVSVAPGSLTADQSIDLTAASVGVSPSSLEVSEGQAISPDTPAIVVSPGSLSLIQDQVINPAAVTVTVSPEALTVAPDQPISLVGASVSIAPGSMVADMALELTGATVTIVPANLQVDETLTLTGETLTLTPGVLTVAAGSQTVDLEGATLAITAGDLTVLFPTTISKVRDEMPVQIKDRTYVVSWSEFQRRNAQSAFTGVDQAAVSGEQSLSADNYWKRTSYNWEQGAGQEWFDRRDSERRRFYASIGVNPWTEGQLSLVNGPNNEGESSVEKIVTANGYLYALDPGVDVRRLATPGGAYSSVSGLGAPQDITTDGSTVWTCDNAEINSFSGAGSASQYSTFNAHKVGYANGRLLAVDNGAKNALYEISDGGSTSTELWTHPSSAFEWQLIIPAPNGIYVVGTAGDTSEVYKITVADSTGDLVPPFPALSMPAGEQIYTMIHYGGLFVLGTSRGIRLATIADAAGHLTFGKVIEISNGVRCLAGRGEDIYFGWGGYEFTAPDGSTVTGSGLGRVRLTEFVEPLVPPYASDVMVRSGSASDDIVEACAFFEDQLYFTRDGALFSDEGDSLVGYLNQGQVEFGAVDDDKRLVAGEVRHPSLPGSSSVTLTIVDEAGTDTDVVTGTTGTETRSLITDESGERWEVFLTLTPDGSNNPTVRRWTLEAIPKPTNFARDILFPIILKEEVIDEVTGQPLWQDIWAEHQYLEGLAENREIIDVIIGSQSLKGFLYDVAVESGAIVDWNRQEDAAEYLTGTFTAMFRTVEGA